MECKIKDISINYEIIGNGKPIIMLHGYSVDHRLMRGCMEPILMIKVIIKEFILTCQAWENQKVQNGLATLILCLTL